VTDEIFLFIAILVFHLTLILIHLGIKLLKNMLSETIGSISIKVANSRKKNKKGKKIFLVEQRPPCHCRQKWLGDHLLTMLLSNLLPKYITFTKLLPISKWHDS
jgi:hypothetical protein